MKKMIKKDKNNNAGEIEKKYLKLKNEVTTHNKLYYEDNNPIITDIEYDALWKKLKSYEKKYSFLKNLDSPTSQIGHKPSQIFSKIKHSKPMLSLDNALNLEETIKYIEKISRFLNIKNQFIELIAEPKIDGLSISLKYKNGKFMLGATRGDGQIGEDVTSNLNMIKDIPKQIPQLNKVKTFELRGEIYMEKKEFLNLNNNRKKSGESFFANPRNAAAGSLRQLDKDIVKLPLILSASKTCKGLLESIVK